MADLEKKQGARESSGTAGDEQALTAKEAYALLAASRPTAVLQALKHPDFAMIAAVGFMGFRVDAQSYANPVVRRRLAEEAVRNSDFAERLRGLAGEAKQTAPITAKPAQIPTQAAKRPEPSREPDPTGKYRVERDRLKQERDQAVDTERVTLRRYGEARAAQLAAETARGKAEQEAVGLRGRLARLERRYRRLEAENALLSRAAAGAIGTQRITVQANAPQNSQSQAPARKPARESERLFADAVRHLLDKQKWPVAIGLASDVLRAAPDNADALSIRAQAFIAQGEIPAAISDLRRLVSAEIGEGNIAGASDALVRLLSLSTRPGSEIKLVREVYTALQVDSTASEAAREIFQRLRTVSPESYHLLEDLAPPELAKRLFGAEPARVVGPDDVLPLPAGPLHGVTLTARRLIETIDSNDIGLFDAAREAARSMTGDARDQVEGALLAAAGEDASYANMLFRESLFGAAVVDASNAAWHGQEMIVGGRPRVGHVVAVRRALRERGFFPILLVADANLPYVADDSARVRQMVRDGEILLAPGGSDADEHILREARRLHAPVISNDYMADWDPGQQVRKVQYDISLVDGHATLYF